MNICLLLTGCIRPNITNDVLVISDIETRKRQYEEAINWYLKNTPYNIVFCENSGTDISTLIQMSHFPKRIEMLTYILGGVKIELRDIKKWKSLNTYTGILNS